MYLLLCICTNQAEHHKTKQIDEDGLLDLIRKKPGKKSKYEVAAEKEALKEKAESTKLVLIMESVLFEATLIVYICRKKTSPPSKPTKQKDSVSSSSFYSKQKSQKTEDTDSQDSIKSLPDSQKLTTDSTPDSAELLLWVDKYKPKSVKQIIGQQGAKSNVEKLKKWLLDWHQNNRPKDGSKPKSKPKVGLFGGGDPTGAGFKAALLSGPPGVGKTTAATLVCKVTCVFSYVMHFL